MALNSTRPERRESDSLATVLNDRISEIGERLERHVTDCSAQSRKLFWAVVAVLGWLVVHSLPFVGKMFP